MAKAKGISIRKFAAKMGVSDAAIRKAIKAGKIVKGYNATEKFIIPSIATTEWKARFNTAKIQSPGLVDKLSGAKGKPNPKKNGEPDDPEDIINGLGDRDPETMDVFTSVKLEKAYTAMKRKAEYLELSGSLINRDTVYRALFEAGQEVRNAVQAIPDRFIDDIYAAKTRNEAHLILTNAVADVLEAISQTVRPDIIK